MPSRNLEPGQYQLGNSVFGYGTPFPVEEFDIGGWEVNAQDYQAQLADETRFGSDSFKPNPIQITMHFEGNRALDHVAALVDSTKELNFANDRKIGEFTREWRADEVRKAWGALKPLYVCRPDGTVVQLFGRPGKLAVSRQNPHSLVRNILAEYRRSDTLCYSDFEWYHQLRVGEQITVYRAMDQDQGDAPSWIRILLVGPMTHPIINIGDKQVELDHELEVGEIVEISSYPWQRRVIRLNDGVNLSPKLVTPRLETLNFDVEMPVIMSWNATDTNANVELEDLGGYSNTTEGLPTAQWFPTVYSTGTGSYKMVSGKLEWIDAGSQERLGVSIFKQPTLTSYQLVGMTLATPAEFSITNDPEATNRIIGRSNSTGTEYFFWEIGYTEVWFGYHLNGVDTRLSKVYYLHAVWNTLSRLLEGAFNLIFGTNRLNWNYDAEFGTGSENLSSVLRINDVRVLEFNSTDAGLTQLLSDTNKYTGIGMKATSRVLGQSTPGSVSEFRMRDNSIDVPGGGENVDVSGIYLFWRDAWQNI